MEESYSPGHRGRMVRARTEEREREGERERGEGEKERERGEGEREREGGECVNDVGTQKESVCVGLEFNPNTSYMHKSLYFTQSYSLCR